MFFQRNRGRWRAFPRVALAAGVGLATLLLTRGWLAGEYAEARAAASPAAATAEILVAAAAVPMGSTLGPADLRWQAWPRAAVAQGYIERAGNGPPILIGSVARTSLMAGEPLTEAKAGKPGEGGTMAAVIQPGRRAVTIAVTDAGGLAGFLVPGDRVDLLLTEARDTAKHTTTVLANVPVLGVDQKSRADIVAAMAQARGQGAPAGLVTIEVTPRQAEQVALAADLGRLTLALRGVARDPAGTEAGRGVAGGSPAAPPAVPAAVAVLGALPAVPRFSPAGTIEIIRGSVDPVAAQVAAPVAAGAKP